MVRMGIIGAGRIAGFMGRTLQGMGTAERYAIAARDYGRAKDFADQYGFEKAYGSYEEMLADPMVDLVYVATPHSHHYDHVKLCLEHGKHVLCEKAFTVNEGQAKELFAMAKERGLLLTEAIWTRYMPMRKTLEEVLASGVIGTPYMLTANLSYIIDWKDRIRKPELAGGALLDIGIYTLNFASMAFGDDIETITGTATFNEHGMDMQENITILYKDGRMAALNSSARSLSDRRGIIYGDKGYIETENINNCEGIKVFDTERKLVASYETPKQITGYEYEVEACVRAIENGELECPEMPHEETLRMLRWMDELRRQWGIVYPMEQD
ncbi:gfo/Idh/MocA family oxidoreductase [Clostridiaceae bacterium]|nr:gfo/Idh/MocA family oxidoreductase [Clostridiaceae bacterium]RKI18300.1 gfo/Idh/MocA family oxidoreductase [bacterium 1XD21-70]